MEARQLGTASGQKTPWAGASNPSQSEATPCVTVAPPSGRGLWLHPLASGHAPILSQEPSLGV